MHTFEAVPSIGTALVQKLMDVLTSVLGDTYCLYWVRHKIVRPFANIRRSWQKHVLHSLPAGKHAAPLQPQHAISKAISSKPAEARSRSA